jgi:vacuolar-type H+-ATPase subunit D/Vma8
MPGVAPPGRAGRIWLAGRIQTAGRAVELLEQKQQLLRQERRRLAELAERTGREWRVLAADAELWNARALVAGGREEIHRARHLAGRAEVRLDWTSQAGVTYPSAAALHLPQPLAPAGPPALATATEACRLALAAAVQHAATTAALARVDAELVAVVRRLRAIRDRSLPRLRAEVVGLDLRLEETEREEATRLRWARSEPAPGQEVRA